MPKFLDKILRAGEGKILKRLDAIAAQVNALSDEFAAMSDAELRAMTDEFKERLADGETLDDLLPEAFATVREASTRVLGQRHFDVQLLGGAALHLGNIAEMKTGEGKTLVATLPSYLNALTGRGVHIVTVNDYLAKYQSEMMGRVHGFLGLTVGVVVAGQTPAQRREAYAADITYGTNNEFGFDYLRDNMADHVENCVQRGHYFAIVDEVDSILIDEARTPLIISGPTEDEVKWYGEFARIVGGMKIDEHYEVDEKKRTISVTDAAIDVVEDQLGIENLYDTVNTPLISFLNNAVKAKELFKRDKDYVVIDGEVLIVDEHTGRLLEGRRYNEGLHQAIEAKEGVRIREEYQTLATITLQNYFRLYEKLSGMTGTAATEAAEFDKIYELGVVPIRTNRPVARVDRPDLIYRNEDVKIEAIIADIVERHQAGQPVLVGTTSVEKSERISKALKKDRIPHQVLNAKHHEREAAIVAMAGHKGAVTVATNMAGRGTDIMLGGNVEFLADEQLRKQGLDPIENAEEYTAAWPAALAEAEKSVAAEKQEVIDAGGLAVIGTERHESRRIDNQLRGRSGRQGDPGESQFYLSLEDDLMRLFKGDWVKWILENLRIPEDVPISDKRVTNQVASAQALVEEQNFESRKNILKYDDVMNSQRTVIYRDRRQILEGVDLRERIVSMIENVVTDYVKAATVGAPSDWDFDQLWTALSTLYPVTLEKPTDKAEHVDPRKLSEELVADALASYERREAELGDEVIRELERRVLLSVVDRKWREHLYEMDYLREGIGLRAYSQRDPLVEYQSEGYDLFVAMMEGISEESVGYLFNLNVEVTVDDENADEIVLSAKGLESESDDTGLTYSAPAEDGSAVAVAAPGEDDDEPGAKARQAKDKAKARAKSKAQRQSRKRNR